MRFGEWVRERREKAGLSLRECARRVGVSHVYLSHIERSVRPMPTEARRAELGAVLGVGPGEMKWWANEEARQTECPTCGKRR